MIRKLTLFITTLLMCGAAAPAIAKSPAPMLTITGETLDWTAVGTTTQYQLRTIHPRTHERSETYVTGVTDTPPANPGERVAYRVRSLNPFTWFVVEPSRGRLPKSRRGPAD